MYRDSDPVTSPFITSDLPMVAWSETAGAELNGFGVLLYSGAEGGVEVWRCGSEGAGILPGVEGFHMFSESFHKQVCTCIAI
jgi:hypothetical protein